MHRYITELVGTFLFVFSIVLAVAHAGAMAPLAIGAALMCMVYMGGHISGGHFNPAVTLGVYLRGGFEGKDLLPYMGSQLLGAALGAVTAASITGASLLVAPAEGVTLLRALLVEGVFTFALVLVVLNVATDPKVDGNSFYGLAIGFTIVVAAFAGGAVSGGAFNPAVGLGTALVAMGSGSVSHAWIYFVGPMAGGAVAALFYRLMHAPE